MQQHEEAQRALEAMMVARRAAPGAPGELGLMALATCMVTPSSLRFVTQPDAFARYLASEGVEALLRPMSDDARAGNKGLPRPLAEEWTGVRRLLPAAWRR